MKCGKHWSRHFVLDPDARIAYCDSSHTATFTLERPAPAAAPAGVAEVRRLITERESARVLLDTAKTNLDDATHSWDECERLDAALNALEKGA